MTSPIRQPAIAPPPIRPAMPRADDPSAWLEAHYRAVYAERMADLPFVNAALQVEAVGFAWQHVDPQASTGVLGILITPWCMNLVWLPDDTQNRPAEGQSQEYQIGGERLEFISVEDDVFGHYQSCSLFSPMFDFSDQQSARETATHVLSLLRRPPRQAPANPSRRSLLFGRLSEERQ